MQIDITIVTLYKVMDYWLKIIIHIFYTIILYRFFCTTARIPNRVFVHLLWNSEIIPVGWLKIPRVFAVAVAQRQMAQLVSSTRRAS